jgi:hypothetical protein
MQFQHTGTRIFVLTVAMLTGCVPVVYTHVPQINGRVIDATGAPKANAAVRVTDELNPKSGFELLIPCGPDGRFLHQADTSWGVFIVGEDNFGTHFRAEAFSPDSRSEPKAFGRDWSQVRMFGLGSVDAFNLGDFTIPQSARGP